MPLSRTAAAARRMALRVRQGEDGFSMVITMIAVMMLTLSAAVSLKSVDADQGPGRLDLSRKVAYSSAEAGLQAYVHRLTDDSSYWTNCVGNNPGGTTTNGSNQTDAVNQWWNGAGTDPRKWANLPDNSGQYTIEQLPANGKTSCATTDPVGTMIDSSTATFRIRVTGRELGPQLKPIGPKRTLIATFKRKSFLDYIYFTDFEIGDPTLYPSRFAPSATQTLENPGNNNVDGSGRRTLDQWGNQVCAQYAYVKGPNGLYRSAQSWSGAANKSAGWYGGSPAKWNSLDVDCSDSDIRFSDSDTVNGPFHSNDSPMICGSPNFGRRPGDAIETAAPGDSSIRDVTKSYRVDPNTGCGSSAPDVNFNGSTAKSDRGTWLMNQGIIQLPPTNQSLDTEATSAYTFTGNTSINLGSLLITVTGTRASDGANLVNAPLPYPANGVIYVRNSTSVGCTGYQLGDPYASRPGCGIASVSGTYGKSLTIGAADDILVTGNVLNGAPTSALLGLVATNFIRVQHKVASQTACAANQSYSSTSNVASGSITNAEIDAALLTLKHSFLVDNYACGATLGTLTVVGAISQKFRGPVGTGSGKTSYSGYLKNYTYDDRLKSLSPPKFLDPAKASWRMKMYQEQSPAT